MKRLTLAALLISAASSQSLNGKSCIVLISTPASKARVEKLADAVVELRGRAQLSREQLPLAVIDQANPTHAPAIKRLGFEAADLPVATTGTIDSSGLPLSANINRPPLSIDPKTVAYYLLAEWGRREKNPPNLPTFPYTPISGDSAKLEGEFLAIPAGKFWRGCCDGELDEFPPTPVEVGPFSIGKREVTVEQYERFVAATQYKTKSEEDGFGWCLNDGEWEKVSGATWRTPGGPDKPAPADAPVTQVTKSDAQAYCDWAKARLPSEDEWEKAARGRNGRRYPWGDKWQASGRKEAASPYGCLAMGGGVREWTDSPFRLYHADVVIKEPKAGRFMVRGGAESDSPRECRATYRFTSLPDSRSDQLGFRVVLSKSAKLGYLGAGAGLGGSSGSSWASSI